MSDQFIGEIRMLGFNFAPRYWAKCDGQILAISQNQALFSLLGTTYGGNGVTTFGLPDLRGRVPMSLGVGATGGSYSLGEFGGEEVHTLNNNEMPAHTHLPNGFDGAGDNAAPTNNLLANPGEADDKRDYGVYDPKAQVQLAPGILAIAGGSQNHENRSPRLVVNFSIALSGAFPSRN